MSHSQSPIPSRQAAGRGPSTFRTTGTSLGEFTSYEQAQELVDRLADAQFPVEHISIVGRDLLNVEQVVQRLSYPRVALSAAMSGMTMGLLIGIGLSLFSPEHSWSAVVPMVIIGGCLWVITNVIGYALQRGKRDFVSQNQIIASRYEVLCEPEFAAGARQALGAPHPVDEGPRNPVL